MGSGIAAHACITNRNFLFSFETRFEFMMETLSEFNDEQLGEMIVVTPC
jgi:hypothetical protein